MTPIQRAARDLTTFDARLIHSIVERYVKAIDGSSLARRREPPLLVELDLAIVHTITGLDLVAMFTASDAELLRDIVCMRAALDHDTGRLANGYVPRFARGEEIAA